MDVQYWLQFWWMIPIAMSICITVNIIGVSGSVLFLPFYTFIFPLLGYHLTPIQIIQVGLFTETCGFLSSTTSFWRQGLIDKKIAGFVLLFAIPMAIVGGYTANHIPGAGLLLIVGTALILLAYLIIRKTSLTTHTNIQTSARKQQTQQPIEKTHIDKKGRTYTYQVKNDPLIVLVALVGGLFQGLVGFSAGELSAVVQILRGTPVRIATGTAHLIIFGASLAAACTHIIIVVNNHDSIPWNILIMTIPSVLLGGQIAGLIAGRLPQQVLRMIMGRFLIFIGFLSIYRALTALKVILPVWLLYIACALFCLSLIVYFLRNGRGIEDKDSSLVMSNETAVPSSPYQPYSDPVI